MVRRLALPALAVVISAASLAACGEDAGTGAAAASGEPVRVVATTTQMGDLVRAVGGDDVEVTQLLAPNADPHDYEPRPSDVRAAAEAALVVRSGGDLDGWVGKVVEQSRSEAAALDAGAGRPHVVRGAEHHEEEEGGEHAGEEEHAEDETDPHWWHDPRNVTYAATKVGQALAKAAPDRAAGFEARARRYGTQVADLDRKLVACVDQVPEEQRKLVTDHDAFATFAARYGFDVVGTIIPARTTQAQPSAGALRELSQAVRRERVPVVFPESSLNPRLARSIADATGVRVGGELYADTLGPKGSPGETYLSAQRANVDTIVRGLTEDRTRCR